MTLKNTRSPWWRSVAPVVALFFLAPLIGEFLLGNLKFSELYFLPFLGLLYGAGAIVIREVTRRAGRGYPTMLGLGLAYALIEEGLVDQMLFNPDYFAGQRELLTTMIPSWGVDVWLTIIVTGMHTFWSIFIPILIIEGLYRKHGEQPWLGMPGFTVMCGIFVAGSLWLCSEAYRESGFWASTPQLVGTSILVAAIVAITFASKIRYAGRPGERGWVPGIWLAGLFAMVMSSLFMLTEQLPHWWKVVSCAAILAIFFWAVSLWSRRPNWSVRHVYALAGGGIVTYAWLGAAMAPETGPKMLIDHLGTGIIVALVTWLFVKAFKRIGQHAPS